MEFNYRTFNSMMTLLIFIFILSEKDNILRNLNGLLSFFEAISGLKINRWKSTILGVNSEVAKLNYWASFVGREVQLAS